MDSGLPLFLDELVERLRNRLQRTTINEQSASRHGGMRFASGFTASQVVHDYGDVCQVVTELAMELKAPITTEDFRALNGCLDDAIAAAVTEHARASEDALSNRNTERLGMLAHELRNQLNSALLSYQILKGGTVSIGGSTGTVLGRSLTALRDLIDRSLAEVRLDVGLHDDYPIEIAGFLADLEPAAVIAANTAKISLSTQFGEPDIHVLGDRQLLGSAVTNLMQNAFKFTHGEGHVSLRTSASSANVLIEVEDECGGLPGHVSTELFKAFHRGSTDRSGLGLGLLIATRAVESMRGRLSVHNMPRKGCVFTIDLPRITSPVAMLIEA